MAGSLADLLTRPGYSTAEEVTGVAGRGVGLDAVRDYVRSFGGSMEIRSEPGAGTEVVLLLPLALSLIEVLLFERGGAVYGLPLAAVAEVVTVTRALALQGRPMLAVRGRPVPLADVAALVGATTSPLPARAPALVIRVTELSVAVACDSLVGQQEIAVKPLGPLLAGADKFLGAAVLGDGRIALLIEPHALLVGLAEVTGPGPAPAAEPAAAPMVLVVEDSFTARELQRSILETAGYQVLTARDGREALDTLGREPAISLVVTDLEMPEIGGLELTRAIRADPVRSSLPVGRCHRARVGRRRSQGDRGRRRRVHGQEELRPARPPGHRRAAGRPLTWCLCCASWSATTPPGTRARSGERSSTTATSRWSPSARTRRRPAPCSAPGPSTWSPSTWRCRG